jgi:hypothetical protein
MNRRTAFPTLPCALVCAAVLAPAAVSAQAAFTPATAGVAVPAADRLGWLAGCWEGTLSNGAAYEEVWLAPRGGVLLGVARMTRDGRTLSFEFIRVLDDDGTLVYAAQPAGRPATPFRATAVVYGDVTFENPEHDFPQRIRYRLDGEAGLHARIEGERDGQVRAIDFPMLRVACPGPA